MAVPTMRKGNVHIIYPRGQFDRKMSAELETKIYELGAKERVNILLNLKRVKGILSHGVHTLVEMYHRCKELGGTIKLCGLKRDVRFVLEFTKLNEVFEIFEEEDAAWKSFRADAANGKAAGGASPASSTPPGSPGSRPSLTDGSKGKAPSWKARGKPPQGKPPKR